MGGKYLQMINTMKGDLTEIKFYAYDGLPGALTYARVDPIISPGQVSGHVHALYGSNAVGVNYDYDRIVSHKNTLSSRQNDRADTHTDQ